MLTPKQMLQRLPVALAQVKAGNTSANLINEIKKLIYSLYGTKEVTKTIYNNIINSKFNKVIKYNRYYIYEFLK